MQYNDPNWGRAAANLAAAFAPPTGQEVAGFARAGLLQTQRNAMDAEAQRLADLYRMATAPDFNQDQFDRMGMAVGNWNPNQSYYAVDTQDATNRRGQDIDASTRRAVQAMANQSAMERAQLAARAQLVGDRYGDLRPGAVRPEMPADVAGMFGLGAFPEMRGAATPEIVQAGIIEELAQNPNMRIDDPRFESRGVLAGLFRPDQTMSSEWAGIEGDLTAARIREEGAMDRQRAEPVMVNQNQTAFLSPEEAVLRDLPEVIMGQASVGRDETIVRPDGSQVLGQQTPMNKSQWEAQQLQALLESGDLTTQMFVDDFLGNQTPVEGYDDQGNVRFMSPGAAVRTGATPYDAPSNVPRNYVMRDGRNFITFDGATDAQTGQPLPPGGAISNVEGGAEDVGLPTTATRSQLQQGQIEVNKFNVLLDRARELSTDPANFGIPGAVKGAAQDATAIAEGVATGLGFTSPREALESIRNDAAANGIDPSLLPGVFDPSLPALHTVADLLVYQAAAALAGQSGRAVSDYDVRRFKNVVGDPRSFMMNRERFLAKLDELQRLVSGVSQVNTQALTGGVAGAPQQPPQPPQPPSPPSPPAPTTASPGADSGTAVIQTPQGQVTIRRID